MKPHWKGKILLGRKGSRWDSWATEFIAFGASMPAFGSKVQWTFSRQHRQLSPHFYIGIHARSHSRPAMTSHLQDDFLPRITIGKVSHFSLEWALSFMFSYVRKTIVVEETCKRGSHYGTFSKHASVLGSSERFLFLKRSKRTPDYRLMNFSPHISGCNIYVRPVKVT